MTSFEHLYSPEKDLISRESGLVYVEDLALSGLMIALKTTCAPQGLGFLHAKTVTREDMHMLHSDLTGAISRAMEENWFSERAENSRDVEIFKGYDGTLGVRVDYWDGRPMKIKFSAGDNLDPNGLTGFEAFQPHLFDRDQGQGVAQQVVDDLRGSGDALSIDVAKNEAGRIFERFNDFLGVTRDNL